MIFFKNGKQKSFKNGLEMIADEKKKESDYQNKLKLRLKGQQEKTIKELKKLGEERLIFFLEAIKETIAEGKQYISFS